MIIFIKDTCIIHILIMIFCVEKKDVIAKFSAFEQDNKHLITVTKRGGSGHTWG